MAMLKLITLFHTIGARRSTHASQKHTCTHSRRLLLYSASQFVLLPTTLILVSCAAGDIVLRARATSVSHGATRQEGQRLESRRTLLIGQCVGAAIHQQHDHDDEGRRATAPVAADEAHDDETGLFHYIICTWTPPAPRHVTPASPKQPTTGVGRLALHTSLLPSSPPCGPTLPHTLSLALLGPRPYAA